VPDPVWDPKVPFRLQPTSPGRTCSGSRVVGGVTTSGESDQGEDQDAFHILSLTFTFALGAPGVAIFLSGELNVKKLIHRETVDETQGELPRDDCPHCGHASKWLRLGTSGLAARSTSEMAILQQLPAGMIVSPCEHSRYRLMARSSCLAGIDDNGALTTRVKWVVRPDGDALLPEASLSSYRILVPKATL
jgi:hypothetical protein